MNRWFALVTFTVLILVGDCFENCASLGTFQCSWNMAGACGGNGCTTCQAINVCKKEPSQSTCMSTLRTECKETTRRCKESGITYTIIFSAGCPVLACGGDEGVECSDDYIGGGVLIIDGLSAIPIQLRSTVAKYLVSDIERAFLSKREMVKGILGINLLYTRQQTKTTIASWGFLADRLNATDLHEIQLVIDSMFSKRIISLEDTRNLALRNELGTDLSINYVDSVRPFIVPPSTPASSSSNNVVLVVGGVLGCLALVAIVVVAVLYYKHTHQANTAITRPSGGNAISDIRKGFSDIGAATDEEEVTRNANRMSRKNRRKQEDNKDETPQDGHTKKQKDEMDEDEICIEMGQRSAQNETTIAIPLENN